MKISLKNTVIWINKDLVAAAEQEAESAVKINELGEDVKNIMGNKSAENQGNYKVNIHRIIKLNIWILKKLICLVGF